MEYSLKREYEISEHEVSEVLKGSETGDKLIID